MTVSDYHRHSVPASLVRGNDHRPSHATEATIGAYEVRDGGPALIINDRYEAWTLFLAPDDARRLADAIRRLCP